MEKTIKSINLILLIFSLAGCDFKMACIGFGGEGLTTVNYTSSYSCSPRLLIFCDENQDLQDILNSDNSDYNQTMVNFYTPEDTKAMFLDYNCFSEDELASISAYNLIKDTGIGLARFSQSTFLYTESYYTTIAPLLFTIHEDYITMKNPYSGNDILMRGVDYVKFKGTPMLPVPPPQK